MGVGRWMVMMMMMRRMMVRMICGPSEQEAPAEE